MLLITGATGFVGRRLLEKLISKRLKVRCLVRDKKKIDKNNDLEIVQGDILYKNALYNATQKVDTVIHLATIIKSSDPEEFTNVNAQGTRNLVEACIKNEVKKIIYVSSLDAVLNETNTYGKTKKIGEDIIKESGIDYIILRPSLIYGKGSKAVMKLSELIKKYPLIPVVGDGEGKFQPVYVDDVCDVILNAIESDVRNKAYCIAGEQKISWNEFIDKIANLFSKRVVKIHVPLWVFWLPLELYSLVVKNPLFDYESLNLLKQDKICDLSEIKKDFGFKPISLDDGLRLVLQN